MYVVVLQPVLEQPDFLFQEKRRDVQKRHIQICIPISLLCCLSNLCCTIIYHYFRNSQCFKFFKTFLKTRGMQMLTVQGQVVLVSHIVPSIFIDLKKDLPKYLHTFV